MQCLKGRLFVLGPVLLFAFAQLVSAGESRPEGELAKKYRELVQRLVSPNTEPVTKEGDVNPGSVKFPRRYDVAAQKRIDEARRALHDNFEEALPFLVEVLDDERYCMTIDWADGNAYYNYSVGDICRDVIRDRLEVYRDKISFSDSPHWNRYSYPISRDWWKARKGRSLAELQIESIDWAIERRKAEPKSQVAPDRKDEISALKKLRDGIAKSGKPVKRTGHRMLPMVTSDR